MRDLHHEHPVCPAKTVAGVRACSEDGPAVAVRDYAQFLGHVLYLYDLPAIDYRRDRMSAHWAAEGRNVASATRVYRYRDKVLVRAIPVLHLDRVAAAAAVPVVQAVTRACITADLCLASEHWDRIRG